MGVFADFLCALLALLVPLGYVMGLILYVAIGCELTGNEVDSIEFGIKNFKHFITASLRCFFYPNYIALCAAGSKINAIGNIILQVFILLIFWPMEFVFFLFSVGLNFFVCVLQIVWYGFIRVFKK